LAYYSYVLFLVYRDNIAAAEKRACIAADHERRRIAIEERNQLIKLYEIGIYSKDEILKKLAALENPQPTDLLKEGSTSAISGSDVDDF
jgi:hypothetical protein